MASHRFRPGLEFDVAALEHYLKNHLTELAAPLKVEQFAGGQSNPSYRLRAGAQQWVLRRKPPGALLPSAHAIEREYRVLRALHAGTRVPVPKPLLLCEDASVIGTAFYLMEFVDGRIYWDPALPDAPCDQRRSIFRAQITALAELHNANPEVLGLGDFGRPAGYAARQIARWDQQYQMEIPNAGRVPRLAAVIAWLGEHLPTQEPAVAVVHGDYRLDNLVFAHDAPQLRAILDWELSTLGDPHADLAYHLLSYRMQSAAIPGLAGRDLAALGIPTESEYLGWYLEARGLREIPHLQFYLAYSFFRLAAIFHGIRGRVARGTAVSPVAQKYAAEVEAMAEHAWAQTRSESNTYDKIN
jgi:aminoglycoside phosphotransferase (APT) family kinase protein